MKERVLNTCKKYSLPAWAFLVTAIVSGVIFWISGIIGAIWTIGLLGLAWRLPSGKMDEIFLKLTPTIIVEWSNSAVPIPDTKPETSWSLKGAYHFGIDLWTGLVRDHPLIVLAICAPALSYLSGWTGSVLSQPPKPETWPQIAGKSAVSFAFAAVVMVIVCFPLWLGERRTYDRYLNACFDRDNPEPLEKRGEGSDWKARYEELDELQKKLLQDHDEALELCSTLQEELKSQQGDSSTRDAAWARSVLGVSVDADAKEIKAAHRKLIKILHPDTGGTRKLFQDVQEAYERLSG